MPIWHTILGVEAICGAQGIGFRAPLKTSPPLQAAVERVAPRHSRCLEADRYLAPDLQSAADLIRLWRAGQRLPGLDMTLSQDTHGRE